MLQEPITALKIFLKCGAVKPQAICKLRFFEKFCLVLVSFAIHAKISSGFANNLLQD